MPDTSCLQEKMYLPLKNSKSQNNIFDFVIFAVTRSTIIDSSFQKVYLYNWWRSFLKNLHM